jgi:hypothetical protein
MSSRKSLKRHKLNRNRGAARQRFHLDARRASLGRMTLRALEMWMQRKHRVSAAPSPAPLLPEAGEKQPRFFY